MQSSSDSLFDIDIENDEFIKELLSDIRNYESYKFMYSEVRNKSKCNKIVFVRKFFNAIIYLCDLKEITECPHPSDLDYGNDYVLYAYKYYEKYIDIIKNGYEQNKEDVLYYFNNNVNDRTDDQMKEISMTRQYKRDRNKLNNKLKEIRSSHFILQRSRTFQLLCEYIGTHHTKEDTLKYVRRLIKLDYIKLKISRDMMQNKDVLYYELENNFEKLRNAVKRYEQNK